jgi:hypothetical protein
MGVKAVRKCFGWIVMICLLSLQAGRKEANKRKWEYYFDHELVLSLVKIVKDLNKAPRDYLQLDKCYYLS